jgi:hypothetical protein
MTEGSVIRQAVAHGDPEAHADDAVKAYAAIGDGAGEQGHGGGA